VNNPELAGQVRQLALGEELQIRWLSAPIQI